MPELEEPDYRQITAADLRRALKSSEGYKEAIEGDLTVYPYGQGELGSSVFAFWGKITPGDTRLHRIVFSAEAQAHFQQLLNPPEDRWDKDLKTPTGLPMHRSDPDATYRGPY